MILKDISLKNFRSFKEKNFSFSNKTTLIFGSNTAGKTNLLEAIYLSSVGKSFRAEVEKEMIGYGKEMSNVRCRTADGNTLEILLTSGEVAGQIAPHKKFLINGVSRRMIDFLGNLRAVLFWPEDMELITDSPSIRRKYLDSILVQIDRDYRRAILSYEKALRQRNRLLERIRDEGINRSQLVFWDKLLIRDGSLITDKRAEFINFVNNFHLLFPPMGKMRLHFHIDYDKSVISEARLNQYTNEEVASATTLVGPHRDDFSISIFEKEISQTEHGRDLSAFGSRGEQRLAILWLKLAELEFVASKTDSRPILLLDDIFSELDHEHRELVLKVIPQQQTIITTTDLHLVDENYLKDVEIIKL